MNYAELMQSSPPVERTEALPLTIPSEVWATFEPSRRQIYQLGQNIVDHLVDFGPAPLVQVAANVEASPVALALAVQLLSGMDLIHVSGDDEEGPVVTLLATPDEHLKIRGPDGKQRWVFIAKPLEEPRREYSDLN